MILRSMHAGQAALLNNTPCMESCRNGHFNDQFEHIPAHTLDKNGTL